MTSIRKHAIIVTLVRKQICTNANGVKKDEYRNHSFVLIELPCVSPSLNEGSSLSRNQEQITIMCLSTRPNRMSLALLSISALFIGFPALAKSTSGRALNNTVGPEVIHRIQCSGDSYVSGMLVDEQYGFGVIDIQFECSDGSITNWAANNPNGNERHVQSGPLSGLGVFEQNGFGVIDFRYYKYTDSGSQDIGRFTYNPHENRVVDIFCPGMAYGAEVYEQGGHGIVDIELLCL